MADFHELPSPHEDNGETREWLDALQDVIRTRGGEHAEELLATLARDMALQGLQPSLPLCTPFRNTIAPEREQPYPGDTYMERRIRSLIRWNALAMVMRANLNDDDLGGHISTFSSSAMLYDVGFNYFFRADTKKQLGDMIYYQGHSSPGIYARSYLEGRFTEKHLDNFRREISGKGLSSYPHPWLMPDYWQFPTVSMGLGPLMGINQAHVLKYLDARGITPLDNRKVWVFCGDGEMDEPESLGAISLAGREQLDNLIFVINCNLQRLDGPVRGNGKIIQELEGVFRGAGWNVIKVIWGRHWDSLLQSDDGRLQHIMDTVVDGELQNFKAHGGAYTREHFFGKDPEVLKRVEHMSDDDIYNLNRGGHDHTKVYAAFHEAVQHQGRPTVILPMTVKGYGIGSRQADNNVHQVKKLTTENLRSFRDQFDIPIADKDLEKLPYYHPGKDSAEVEYMLERRKALGGFLPSRRKQFSKTEPAPGADTFTSHFKGSGDRAISTTMALVRIIASLLKDKHYSKRVVPIVPDEARTFGMEGMFRQFGIYSSQGQCYEPEDAGQLTAYRESREGVMLQEGINEAGSMSAWLALATSYSTNDKPMLPFYLFYSMFGFQRTHDLCWAAGDKGARGFLIGATAGRTTLNGEGLQHQDGHSHLLASTVPNCRAYDPTYGYEIAVLVQEGIRQMYEKGENCYYYLTVENENYTHPPMPKPVRSVKQGIVRGMYLLHEGKGPVAKRVNLMGSGSILREVEAAAEILREDFSVDSDVWSVPGFNELRREGLLIERGNRLNPEREAKRCWVQECLEGRGKVSVAASDYIAAYADQIRSWVPGSYHVLGTDGFGRSDTRANLREFFEVNRNHIAYAALYGLNQDARYKTADLLKARKKLGINAAVAAPQSR